MSDSLTPLRTVHVTRYNMPLREGGSLPAIVEADDEVLYVLKFRGAGQGAKALIAELIGGEIARALGLRMPEIVLAELDAAFGRTESDAEIQDLLKASVGLNLAMRYLSGAITYDPAVTPIAPRLASEIVWLDNLLLNVDRTSRNTNMLIWHRELWLIDHGASMFFHHSWNNWLQKATMPFDNIKSHVLLGRATELEAVDIDFHRILTHDLIREIVAMVPDAWLAANVHFDNIADHRQAYIDFLLARVAYSPTFVKDIAHARETLI